MQTIQNPIQTASSPLISFIITTYDLPSEMLRDCLDSILALSLDKDEREIVLIDDGSKVSPFGDLGDFADDILFIRQKNCGLSQARNRGIQCSNGTYLQFVDGDDMLNTQVYDFCIGLLRHHSPDIVTFHLTDKRDVQVPNGHEELMTGSEYMRHHNLRASACGYIFKKALLLNHRFTPDILHEDEEFTPLLFLRADRLIATEARAYYYRQRPSSIMHQNDEQWINRRLTDMRNVLFRLHDRCATLPQEEREALQRRVHQLTMDYLYNVITLTHSCDRLEEVLPPLHERGLFPLPDKNYTTKYIMFRKMVNSSRGRKLLCRMLKGTSPNPSQGGE